VHVVGGQEAAAGQETPVAAVDGVPGARAALTVGERGTGAGAAG